MLDSTPSFPRDEIRVIHRSRFNDYLISQGGHTFPAAPAIVAHRFGEIFLRCITSEPDCWICYDAPDMARIAANRRRYEAVGTTIVPPKFGLQCRYGIWDHARKELYGAMPSIDRHYGMMSESYESAQRFIDEIGGAGLRVPDEYIVLTSNGRDKSAAQRISEHNSAAVDAVTAILGQPVQAAV